MLLLLLLSYYCCFHITPVTSAFPGAAELTTQLLRLISILYLPLCRINKFGFYFPRRLSRSPILVGHHPSAYLKPPLRNPQYREPRYGKPSRDAAAANPISGDSGDRLRHPAGEGNHLPEDSTPPWSPPEWCVSSLPLDYGSIAVARWLSSPHCASLSDLVSCLTWSRSSICNSICCVCWDPMNREYLLCWLSKLYLCVVYDLACSPLLVDALAK